MLGDDCTIFLGMAGALSAGGMRLIVAHLIETSRVDGWPGSALLLVPPRFAEDATSPVGPHPDVRGLITTAMACWALARWAAQ